MTLLVGLDQGTSSTRCVVVDDELNEVASASVAVECSFPGPGLVEQDPEALARSAAEAIAGSGKRAADVAALGIANQTETFVVWDRASGRPVHPAIVWQDRRTDGACAALREHESWVRERTGLELDATFPATKLRWVLDHVDGDLAYGDVTSWLLHRLAGVHVTDAGNAGRSLLCPLGGDDWDDELLDLFGIPRALMPPIVDSDAIDARLEGIPVRAAAGDQQASLFGLRCWEPGTAKVTLGTGAFVLAQAGTTAPRPPDGILASCAWRREGTTSYALEGFIPTAAAAVDWFARIGALPPARELDELLPNGRPGPVCVPVLQGFGSPSWDAAARGALLGLELGTTRADLARAVVDGIVHQVADAVEAIGTLETLRIDGGLSRSDWTAQRLADLAGVRVQRTARPDTTALGAAMLAGLAAGVWDDLASVPEIPVDLVAEPALPAAERERERERWVAACELVARTPKRVSRS
jgi:glycerol kinase